MENESFEDIIKSYSNRKPSAFTTEPIRKGLLEQAILGNKKGGRNDQSRSADASTRRSEKGHNVQSGAPDTRVKRKQDTTKKIKEVEDLLTGDQVFEPGRNLNRQGRMGNGARPYGRTPNQGIFLRNDPYGRLVWRPERPDVILGKRDAPAYIWNPPANDKQPRSPKYNLAVQNFGTSNSYISKYGRPFKHKDGKHLTGDISQALLRDKRTGEIITQIPEEVPVEQVRQLYEPVMANDEDNKQMIYSSGKEKDDYYEREREWNTQYEVESQVQRVLRKYADKTGIPFEKLLFDRTPEGTGVYDQVYSIIDQQVRDEETGMRAKAAMEAEKYELLRNQASQAANRRLAQHTQDYQDYLERPDAFSEPVPQPKGAWVFGTGDAKHKGYYTYAPQLRRYYKEELAKLLGQPVPPDDDDEFDAQGYVEDITRQYPEMANVLNGLSTDQLERMYNRGYSFDKFYTYDENGKRVLKPVEEDGPPEDIIKEFLDLEESEDREHDKYDQQQRADALAHLSAEAQRNIQATVDNEVKRAKKIFSQYGIPIDEKREARLRAALTNKLTKQLNTGGDMKGNIWKEYTSSDLENRGDQLRQAAIQERLQNLLAGHDKNRVDPAEEKLASLTGNYIQTNDRYNNLQSMLREAQARGDQNAVRNITRKIEEARGTLDAMRTDIISGAQQRGYLDENGMVSNPQFNMPIGTPFDEDTGNINVDFHRMITGPQRRKGWLTSMASAPKDVDDLINIMTSTGKLPMTFRPKDMESKTKKPSRFITNTMRRYAAPEVPPDLQDIYDPTATEIYWKLMKLYGGSLPDESRKRLDQARQDTLFKMGREGRSEDKRQQIADHLASTKYTTNGFMNENLTNIKYSFSWRVKPEFLSDFYNSLDYNVAEELKKDPSIARDYGRLMNLAIEVADYTVPHTGFYTPDEIQANLKAYREKIANMPQEEKEAMMGEKPAWTGSRGVTSLLNVDNATKLFSKVLSETVADGYREEVAQMIMDKPGVSHQGILKMLNDIANEYEGVIIGDPQQLAFASQHMMDARRNHDDILNGPEGMFSGDVDESEKAAEEFKSKLTDETGKVLPPRVKYQKPEQGDPLIPPAMLIAQRRGISLDDAKKIAQKQMEDQLTDQAAGKPSTDISSSNGTPTADGQAISVGNKELAGRTGVNLKRAREAAQANAEKNIVKPDIDARNKATAEAEASAQTDKITQEETAAAEAEEKRKTQDETRKGLESSEDQIDQIIGSRDREGVFKSWSMRDMENMSIRDMMNAIAKSDGKEGHPYGKPIQGNVFAYGSTVSTLGDGRDTPMPATIPTKKTNDEGATSRKLEL